MPTLCCCEMTVALHSPVVTPRQRDHNSVADVLGLTLHPRPPQAQWLPESACAVDGNVVFTLPDTSPRQVYSPSQQLWVLG